MKVFVVSHSSVMDVNQHIYVSLRQVENTEVALLVPANWRNELTGKMVEPKVLPEVDFPIFHRPVGFPGSPSLHYYKSLPLKEIRKFAPDVIHSTSEPWSLSGAQAMWIARTLRVPYVFKCNQNLVKNYPPPFSLIEQAHYKSGDTVIACSEEVKQMMLTKGLRGPCEVVPFGMDLTMFSRKDSAALREKFGLTGAVVIGYLGRLVPEKGIDTIIDAMVRLKAMPAEALGGKKVKAFIVGAGVAEEDLKQQAQRLGVADDIVFAGPAGHSEVAEYYSCMDICAVPSKTVANWKEQFGRVIIEALACGACVVGSDSGEVPHLTRATGGGRVFPEGDDKALAAHLAELVRDEKERNRLAEVGKRTINERYTNSEVARQTYKILERVARGTATRSAGMASS